MRKYEEIEDMMSKSMCVGKAQTAEFNSLVNDARYELDYCQSERQLSKKSEPPRTLSKFPKPLQVEPKFDTDALHQFMNTIEVQFCITSYSTRQQLSNTKQVRGRQTLVQNGKKIWLENQSDCVHSMFDTKQLRVIFQDTSKQTRQEILARSHCNDLIGFVTIFGQLSEVRDSIFRHIHSDSDSDKYGINAAYSELITALQDYIRDSNEYKAIYEQMKIADATERYLTTLLYNIIFPKSPTARDIELLMRIQTLEWIGDDHLEIKPKNRLNDVWQEAAELFNTIDHYHNAVDKLRVLLQTTQIVTDTLQRVNNEASSADVVFPIIIKILIAAKPKRLQSNVNFVELFINKSRMMSESGYCFTQLKSAILWLESVTHEQLKISKIDFERLVYSKEVKYGMVKMRTRKERMLIKLN